MNRICLLRHSLTAANLRRLYCGSTDLSLCEEGILLARENARNPRYAAVGGRHFYTSGMRRTEETLRILFGPLPHDILPEFAEMDFGRFEMKSYEDLKSDAAYLAWISGDNQKNRCPCGESGETFTTRVLHAFSRLPPDEDAVIVCHGGVVSAVMAHAFPEERRTRYAWQPPPCGGYDLTYEKGRYSSYTIL